jgi:hypothetical protein
MPSTYAMHDLLAEVTDDLAKRSITAWGPAFGTSPALKEAEDIAAILRSDGVTAWGTAPMEVVWKAAQLLYVAVLEYARAAAMLMVPPFRTWAPVTEVRSAVEAAGQASWLLDPKVPEGRTRVGRYYTLRLYAARQLEYTYGKIQPEGQLHEFGMPPSGVEAEAGSLGLVPVVNKKNDCIGYEGQQMAKIDGLAQEIVGGNGAYQPVLGSGSLGVLVTARRVPGRDASPLGVSRAEHEADPGSYVPVVRACLQALFKPIDYAAEMFDRPALARDVSRMYRDAVGLLGA